MFPFFVLLPVLAAREPTLVDAMKNGDGLMIAAVGAQHLLVSHERGPVVMDLKGDVIGGLDGPARRPEAIATSADGRWIVVSTWEGLMRYRVAK